MSADKYKIESESNENNSIFTLKISNDAKAITGYVYYFNKFDDGNKTIQNLSEFNGEAKKIHIIVYNGRDLAYYKPHKDNPINADKLLKKLNEYAKCIIINISVNKNINTYIFLREEESKINTEGIFEQMKKEIQEKFEKYNLINIVRALFNLIEDYHINNDGVEQATAAATAAATTEEQAAEEVTKRERDGHGTFAPGARVVLHGMTRNVAYNGLVGTVGSVLVDGRLEVDVDTLGKKISVKPENMQLTRLSNTGGGKRKYKTNVNQKSLKKMSTIIKKLLKINLNIKPVAKPTAKPKAKPTAKPKAKPTAKPKAKPVAKPTAKPTAKPKAKPKAKPAAKPKAKPVAKPKAKPKSQTKSQANRQANC